MRLWGFPALAGWLPRACFCLAVGLGRVVAPPAQPATPPAVSLPASPAAAGKDTVALDLQRDEGGLVVRLQEFSGLIRSLFDDASVSWDAGSGTVLIEQGGRHIQALAAQPRIIVNGEPRPTSRPIVEKAGRVMVPVETIEVVLHELGVEFEMTSRGALPRITPTPTPPPTPAATAAPTVAPAVTPPPSSARPAGAIATPAATPGVPPTAPATADSLAAEHLAAPATAPAEAASPLLTPLPRQAPGDQPPGQDDPSVALADGTHGLAWRALADRQHAAPHRIAVLHDQRLADAASLLGETLKTQGLEVELIPRDDPAHEAVLVASTLREQRPDVVLFLLLDPALMAAGDGTAAPPPPLLLAAHEALWPLDGRNEDSPTPGAAGPGILAGETTAPARYLPHQFHNLALAGQVERALAAADPPVAARLQLAPLGLLRQTEFPAMAVLLPTPQAPAGLASGVAQGVAEYCRRLQLGF